MFHRAYLGLGSNLGDRTEHLKKALVSLSRIGKVKKVSSLYETEPLGVQDQPGFLNAVVLFETFLEPRALLKGLKRIEKNLGRFSGGPRWGPRVVDLDILSFDDLILSEEGLTIPHPEMERRRFVLEPLSEIAPGWVHPVSGKPVEILLEECPAQKSIRVGGFDA
jgi:2-amino-4-hydroxy-6-hydroxymethyldihydropteridine diphosphokinase